MRRGKTCNRQLSRSSSQLFHFNGHFGQRERERKSCLSLPAGKTLHAAAAALLLPASVTGRSATADWCRVGWSGRLRLSGGRVGPKYFAGAAAAGSTAGRTNQTLLTLLPSDTICPCAFNCFLLNTYMSCCLCALLLSRVRRL